jgi:hypothetical protein
MALLALPGRADPTTSDPETLIRLTVYPAAAPKPALKYRLLPELQEMNPGNPVQNYFKCFLEQQKFFFDKEAFQRREKLLAMPLKELPAHELQDYGGFALSQADWAARLDNPDWQILLKVKTDGVSLLLPDLQDIRTLANPLKLRFRAEVAMGRFDKAVRTAQTMFAMARHVGENPTLVGNLVGLTIANTAIGPLEEMLEQSGCPNFYWALTNLPNPLVPVDKGMEGERASISSEFRGLDDAPMSAQQLQSVITHWDIILGDGKPPKPGESRVRAWLDARTKDDERLSAARRRLVEHGLPLERLERFPADQIVLLDEKREYDVRFDDLRKTMTLPVWQAEALAAHTPPAREPALFADVLVPGVYGVRLKQARLEQRIALLRHVEALRLYAAEHHGALPAKLSEIPLPLPDDPFTGKPFRYEVQGRTAHLRGSPPAREKKDPSYNLHYVVTLQN